MDPKFVRYACLYGDGHFLFGAFEFPRRANQEIPYRWFTKRFGIVRNLHLIERCGNILRFEEGEVRIGDNYCMYKRRYYPSLMNFV
jgi:hypothetical protein